MKPIKVWVIKTGSGHDPEPIMIITSTKEKAFAWMDNYIQQQRNKNRTDEYVQTHIPERWEFKWDEKHVLWYNSFEYICAEGYEIDKTVGELQ